MYSRLLWRCFFFPSMLSLMSHQTNGGELKKGLGPVDQLVDRCVRNAEASGSNMVKLIDFSNEIPDRSIKSIKNLINRYYPITNF